MSPTRRRRAVAHVRRLLAVSERRACRVLSQPRMTQRYETTRPDDEERLVARMRGLAAKHPRYGYRRIWALLRREGWSINRKRVHRLWRREGRNVARPQKRKRSLGSSENSCSTRKAESPNHVWTWDFIHDRTMCRGPLKLLSLVDEYTRECLALEVSGSITAQDAIAVLRRQFLVQGAPACIRSDNGPEFIAKAIQGWLESASVETLYVAPGSPWEKYPRNMVFARALTNGARWYCPDVFNGPIYTPDELGAGVAIDSQGDEVYEAPHVEPVAPAVQELLATPSAATPQPLRTFDNSSGVGTGLYKDPATNLRTDGTPWPTKPEQTECPLHPTFWFNKGKTMKGFAHAPVVEGGEWCNRNEALAQTPQTQEAGGVLNLGGDEPW